MSGEPNSVSTIALAQQKAIESLFDDLPELYKERSVALLAIRRAFYAELIKRLEPSFNDYAKTLPSETDRERRSLSSWVNQTLRHFDLALICPVTGKTASLVAGEVKSTTKFRFLTKIEATRPLQKSRYQHFGASEKLPYLKLMLAPPHIENFPVKDRRQDFGDLLR